MDLHKIRLCGTFTTLRKVHAELESLRLKKSATILLSCFISVLAPDGKEWQLVRFITWKSSRRMQMQS